MMKDIEAIVLAAGQGTRMKSKIPKPLHAISGTPMLSHIIDTVRASGVAKTTLVLGHGIEKIKKAYPGFNIAHQKKLLGSAHAVSTARRFFKNLKGDVLVACADTPLIKCDTIKKLMAAHKKGFFGCTVLTARLDRPFGYGRVVRSKDGITKIVEEKDATPGEKNIREINVGAYVFKKKHLFSHIERIAMNPKKKEYYLTDIVNIFKKNGIKVGSFTTPDPEEGIGINSRSELASVHRILNERVINNFMEKGVTITDPSTTKIYPGTRIGKDAVIFPNTIIENDTEIGENCKIGPFARIRPGTKIATGAEIGNFVELVRTKIGKNSKVKHMSYLGDTTVGKNVNIGAGTITANYDGIEKYKTVIEDGAFIGVGAILIAPVRVGKGAVVGAGSVVTKRKNVPRGVTVAGVPAKAMGR